jgi:hypothetical protein
VVDVVTSNDAVTSPEATLERQMQSPRAGDAVMPRPRPPSSRRRSHALSGTTVGRETQSHLTRGQPRMGDAAMAHPRPLSGVRRNHASPETTLVREMQSLLTRDHPWVGDAGRGANESDRSG